MYGLLAAIYKKIIVARNARFDDGRTASHGLEARTISVGNITAGGTGKTPLVIKIAEMMAARGKRVCILTRGYGRKNEKRRVIVTDGRTSTLDTSIAGDEPVELARRLAGKAVIIADADRTAAGKWAKDEYGVSVFVLDDGFQHRQVKRDVDIVCIDATDPFGGERLLPVGRLREPLEGLRRASAIVITRAEQAIDLSTIRGEIERYAPGIPIFTCSSRMRSLREIGSYLGNDDESSRQNGLSGLAHTKAFAFCGIAKPENFFRQLRSDNFQLAGERSFKDHHKYSPADVALIEKLAKNAGAEYLVTTAKDAVKFDGLRSTMPCFVVENQTIISDETKFASLL